MMVALSVNPNKTVYLLFNPNISIIFVALILILLLFRHTTRQKTLALFSNLISLWTSKSLL